MARDGSRSLEIARGRSGRSGQTLRTASRSVQVRQTRDGRSRQVTDLNTIDGQEEVQEEPQRDEMLQAINAFVVTNNTFKKRLKKFGRMIEILADDDLKVQRAL